MEKKKLIVHLGFPKTGTTFLQKYFFPLIENTVYIDRTYNTKYDSFLKSIENLLLFLSDEAFKSQLDKFINDFEKIVNNNSTKILISDEVLLFRTIEPIPIRWHGHFAASFDRLINRLDCFSERSGYEVKIILTLRKQSDLLHSLYAERYHLFQQEPQYKSFSKYIDTCLIKEYYTSGLMNLEYDVLINKLVGLIGTKNVLIIKHENILINDESEYLRILTFLESMKSVSFIQNNLRDKKANVRSSPQGKLANNKANDAIIRNLSGMFNIIPFKRTLGSFFNLRWFFKKFSDFRSRKQIYIEVREADKVLINEKYFSSNKTLSKEYPEFKDYLEE